ncbi:MAG: hypothetical protein AAB475_00690 [Patescibacteria group bacterium]
MNTKEKNIPCWYELGWDEVTKSLILRVHKDFAKNSYTFLDSDSIIQNYTRDFGFSSYSQDFSTDYFGFDDVFKRRGDVGEFIEYEVKISYIGKEVVCNFCSCDAENFFNKPCLFCGDSKVMISYDFKHTFAVSASFTTFFILASWRRYEKTSSNQFQLFEINTTTQRGLNGGSLT